MANLREGNANWQRAGPSVATIRRIRRTPAVFAFFVVVVVAVVFVAANGKVSGATRHSLPQSPRDSGKNFFGFVWPVIFCVRVLFRVRLKLLQYNILFARKDTNVSQI